METQVKETQNRYRQKLPWEEGSERKKGEATSVIVKNQGYKIKTDPNSHTPIALQCIAIHCMNVGLTHSSSVLVLFTP